MARRDSADPSQLHRTTVPNFSQHTEVERVSTPRENAGHYGIQESRPVNALMSSGEPDVVALPAPEESRGLQRTIVDRATSPASPAIHLDAGRIVPEDLWSAPQDERIDVPSTESRLEGGEFRAAGSLIQITQTASSNLPAHEKPLPKSTERQAATAASRTIPTIQTISKHSSESNASQAPPVYAALAVERGLQSTVKVDQQSPDISLRDPESGSKPNNAATSQNPLARVSPREQRVSIPSRIAPLVEMGPERFLLNRRSPQPTVHVTIGRVEVRAVRSLQQSRSASKESPSQPVMKLDEYLRGRNQGSAR